MSDHYAGTLLKLHADVEVVIHHRKSEGISRICIALRNLRDALHPVAAVRGYGQGHGIALVVGTGGRTKGGRTVFTMAQIHIMGV